MGKIRHATNVAARVARRHACMQVCAHVMCVCCVISLWHVQEYANTEQGSVPLLPDLCSLSVP